MSESDQIGTSKRKTSAATRPTSFGQEITRIATTEAGARLIAKVIRELLAAQRFADPGALRDAVEQRCRALRLACTRDQIERAMDLVGSNAQLLSANQKAAVKHAPTELPSVVNHADARAFLDRVGADVSGGRLQRRAATSRLVPL